MRIESVEVHHVAMPLVYPFRWGGRDEETIESVLVRLTADGLDAWGESTPMRFPAYSPEYAAGAFATVRDILAPLVVGDDIASGEELHARFSLCKGNHFAKAALDLAWWDLHAKSRSEPLWKLLGGQRGAIEVGADFGAMETIDRLLETIEKALADGFKRVKLKYRPGWDLDMVRAVRAAFPDAVFHVDCNSLYTLADLPMFEELDRYGLAMIEQPLAHDDLIDHAELQRRIATPVCLDESVTSVDKARKAIDIGACRWVNIKPGRVGGITNAVAIHDLCEKEGIPCWIGGMLESAVGAWFCAALATLSNIKYPSDVFPSSRFYAQDLGVPALELSGPSQITLPSRPGAGAEPDPDRLERMTLQRAAVR